MTTLLRPPLPNSKYNILINNTGHACLADFGSFMLAADQLMDTPSSKPGGTLQWMSPELMDPERFGLEDGHPTKESDCYALGMVVYEVLSGMVPFAPYGDYVVLRKITEGDRPARPQGEEGELFTDDIWDTVQLCWKHQPRDRISADTVLSRLERHPPLLRPSSNVDGNAEIGSQPEPGTDGQRDTKASNCTFSPFIPGLSFILLALDRTADCTRYQWALGSTAVK
jgi:serine/threonine protein kinase